MPPAYLAQQWRPHPWAPMHLLGLSTRAPDRHKGNSLGRYVSVHEAEVCAHAGMPQVCVSGDVSGERSSRGPCAIPTTYDCSTECSWSKITTSAGGMLISGHHTTTGRKPFGTGFSYRSIHMMFILLCLIVSQHKLSTSKAGLLAFVSHHSNKQASPSSFPSG